ncbi:MAG: ribosome assembly factor SBDS [Candidatus Diapherotrites archaeon]|nr:ribosome assembly factor SBDS [Candidatus Diapherotrites archaeon]
MVKLEDAVIARMEKFGESFEVLVDPGLALKLKRNEPITENEENELLAVEEIFKDAKKGERQSEQLLAKVFGTENKLEIAKRIIKQGEVQLTTEQRREMKEAKENEIVEFIAKNAINPQTNTPHPPNRIKTAMKEAKINVDIFKSTEEQVMQIIEELKKVIPISYEIQKIRIKVPPEFSGKASSIIYKYNVKKDEWLSDGSFTAVVEIPVGMRAELFDELNKATQGKVETEILEG